MEKLNKIVLLKYYVHTTQYKILCINNVMTLNIISSLNWVKKIQKMIKFQYILDTERSVECINFTTMCFSINIDKQFLLGQNA